MPYSGGYILCSTRDESPKRPKANNPEILHSPAHRIICPVDPLGGGTWCGTNDAGQSIILLNGGYEKHIPTGNYRKSRGLIVREMLENTFDTGFWDALPLQAIEPFTLVVHTGKNLFELVWDGNYKHLAEHGLHDARIWGSSTLYSPEVKAYRKQLFQNWLNHSPERNTENLLRFLYSWSDSENGFIMNRHSIVQTLSVSVLDHIPGYTTFYYHDLSVAEPMKVSFPIKRS